MKINLLLLFLIFLASADYARSCPQSEFGVPPCANFTRAAAVFLGKVIKIEGLDGKEEYPAGARKIRFKVLENFKGADNPTFTLTTPDSNAACALNIKAGQTWIIYAGHDIDGKGFYDFRGVKFNPKENTGELETLKTVSSGRTEASISGRLASSAQTGKYTYEPVEITIEGSGGRQTTKTDAEGVFHLSPLAAGKYKVKMNFPYRAGLLWNEFLLKTSYTEGIPTFFEYEVEVKPGDCDYNFFEVLKRAP